ncbi:conjugal transfer protein TraH, partial [Burkholderia multivorans]
ATAGQPPAEATAPTPAFTPPPSTGSPTLDALEENRRPKASTVCEHCPNSVWFASPAEVKCYCRVMFLVTWSSKEPNQITHCDGEFLGQEQE